MSTLGKLLFSWLMVFQLLSRELSKGWCRAVPLLLAARAPGPAGLSDEGHKPVEWGTGQRVGSRQSEADLKPSLLLLLLLLTMRLYRPKSKDNGSTPSATACDLSSQKR